MPIFLKRLLLGSAAFVLILVLAFFAIACWPSHRPILAFLKHPIFDYATARSTAASLLATPPPEVRPECRSTVLDHGHRTRDAYVLLHGLTNCPMQFRKFADQIYGGGANVLLLRLPFHGFTDRMTDAQANLTAQEMLDSANEAVDLAHGYGDRIIVVGLSVSAVSAAWLAQRRDDIDLAVVIAPFLAPHGVPDAAIAPLDNLLLRLPNAFIWWDPKQKENLVGSPVSYPRFATRSIGEVMNMGLDLFAEARRAPPRIRKILLITSPADTAISLPRVDELHSLWKEASRRLTFPVQWEVPHDCIDPSQPGEQTARVYPQLLAWIRDALD